MTPLHLMLNLRKQTNSNDILTSWWSCTVNKLNERNMNNDIRWVNRWDRHERLTEKISSYTLRRRKNSSRPPTCSNSLQISIVRNPMLKNLSVERNWNTGSTISYDFNVRGFVSSTWPSLPNLALAESSGTKGLWRTGFCPSNRTSRAKPQRNRNSSGFSWTMLYPEMKVFSDVFSVVWEDRFNSKCKGTASSATAWKITGQAASKHGCNFAETRGDWMPSRNGFHCKQGKHRKFTHKIP